MDTIRGEVACAGGAQRISGVARVINYSDYLSKLGHGEILICPMTGPDWMDVFTKAKAIVTIQGGRLCHAAIIAKQFNMPCIVGANGAATDLLDGKNVVLDMTAGTIEVVENMDTAEGRDGAWHAAASAGRDAVPALDMRSRWGSFGED